MAESLFIRAYEVIHLLGVSKSEAYKKLNEQKAEKGYIVVNGRMNRKYLEAHIYGYELEGCQGGIYYGCLQGQKRHLVCLCQIYQVKG